MNKSMIEKSKLRYPIDNKNELANIINLSKQSAYLTGASECAAIIKTLVEALEFYGKVFNYDNCFRSDLGSYVNANSEGTSEIESDRGKKSRQTLEAYKKWSGE